MKKFRTVLIITLLLASDLFAQKATVNENYKLQKFPVKISVVPFGGVDIKFIQAVQRTIINDSLKDITLANLQLVYNNILNNSSLVKSLDVMTKKEYTADEIKKGAKLSSLLSPEDMTVVTRSLDNSDVIIIPTVVKEKAVAKKPAPKGTPPMPKRFRMYDLNTGDLILEYTADVKVANPTKEAIAEAFHKYYSSNFTAKNNISRKN